MIGDEEPDWLESHADDGSGVIIMVASDFRTTSYHFKDWHVCIFLARSAFEQAFRQTNYLPSTWCHLELRLPFRPPCACSCTAWRNRQVLLSLYSKQYLALLHRGHIGHYRLPAAIEAMESIVRFEVALQGYVHKRLLRSQMTFVLIVDK